MATAAQTAATPSSVKATLWILLVVYIFNFIDRQIVNILEPIVKIEVICPEESIGELMRMCDGRRGEFKGQVFMHRPQAEPFELVRR